LQNRFGALQQGLKEAGWIDGRNIRIELRVGAGDANRIREYTEELVAFAPDVIVVSGAAAAAPVLKATHSVPVVFLGIVDPVGAGFVDSLARPGGYATGFSADVWPTSTPMKSTEFPGTK
jgi:putative ABC transport system substrate-binding protein